MKKNKLFMVVIVLVLLLSFGCSPKAVVSQELPPVDGEPLSGPVVAKNTTGANAELPKKVVSNEAAVEQPLQTKHQEAVPEVIVMEENPVKVLKELSCDKTAFENLKDASMPASINIPAGEKAIFSMDSGSAELLGTVVDLSSSNGSILSVINEFDKDVLVQLPMDTGINLDSGRYNIHGCVFSGDSELLFEKAGNWHNGTYGDRKELTATIMINPEGKVSYTYKAYPEYKRIDKPEEVPCDQNIIVNYGDPEGDYYTEILPGQTVDISSDDGILLARLSSDVTEDYFWTQVLSQNFVASVTNSSDKSIFLFYLVPYNNDTRSVNVHACNFSDGSQAAQWQEREDYPIFETFVIDGTETIK